MSMLDTDGLSTIVITNADREVLYESTSINSNDNQERMENELNRALLGFDEFYSRFENGAFPATPLFPLCATLR